MDEVNRQYNEIATTTLRLKEIGNVIIIGDFNARIGITHPEYNQDENRNGRLLNQAIKNAELVILNTSPDTIHWTRENRKDAREKSIIDFVITDTETEQQVTDLEIDRTGTLTLRGNKVSDHNTITLKLKITPLKVWGKTKKIWKKGTKDQWDAFNREINSIDLHHQEYDKIQKTITNALEKNIGKVSIRPQKKTQLPERAKETQERVRELKAKYQEAIKHQEPYDMISQKREAYHREQAELIQLLHKTETENTRRKMARLVEEGGACSSYFWKVRRRLLQPNTSNEPDTLDNDGNPITNPDAAKAHIQHFYENLYSPREPREDCKIENDNIIANNKRRRNCKNTPNTNPFTMEELNTVIKHLKPNKATGPDNIPNRIFTEANHKTKCTYLKILNVITKERKIPNEWQEGEILRLYKGKGKKGMCNNERGITLSSNIGKVYERLVNNRIANRINITEAQAGGRKGKSTANHIEKIKEAIENNKAKKKPTYITFLDVTKAYDKAWLDGIMDVLAKNGCPPPEWLLIDKLNQNLSARIRTKHGLTNPIKIKDSIRQGGVLAVTQYAILMDEINKEIQKAKTDNANGIKDNSFCLLWVDDVAIITDNCEDQHKLMHITEQVANKYRIVFGKDKSKILLIGSRKEPPHPKINEMVIETTQQYKYLGEVFNKKGNIDDQLNTLQGKTEAALQTIQFLAADENFRGVEMKTIWSLLETCIIPIITYGAETWTPNKTQTTKANKLLDNIIKRLMGIPQSTPRECIYHELAILDTEHRILEKQLLHLIKRAKNEGKSIEELQNDARPKTWVHNITTKSKDLNLHTATLLALSKPMTAKAIHKAVKEHMQEKNHREGNQKSKYKHLDENSKNEKPRKEYMDKLTRDQARIIFCARTRMLKVKSNYKNMHPNLQCRGCGLEEETQKHILEECQEIRKTLKNDGSANYNKIFSEDTQVLKQVAAELKKVEATLESWVQAQLPPG